MPDPTPDRPLRALALTCSLKPSPAESSTDLLTRQLLDELATHGVQGELVRAADHDIRPGVAHHITSILYQSLGDVGFTIPAGGVTFWNGEAMSGTDYKDLDETPDSTASATRTAAANAAHLAALLRDRGYPPAA